MKKLPYLTNLILKLAPKVGAKVVLEPEWNRIGQIIYKNGVVRSFNFYSLDLNNFASAKIAKDKHFAKIFMRKSGYPVAAGVSIFENNWAKQIKSTRTISTASKYAKKLGYPIIVKPNTKSQGYKVSLVRDLKELQTNLKDIFKEEKVAIIEKYIPGRDYRVVILDGQTISAYERIALSVTGDGKSSINNLLQKKQKEFIKKRRSAQIDFKDPRIKSKLKIQGLNFSSILPKGEKLDYSKK